MNSPPAAAWLSGLHISLPSLEHLRGQHLSPQEVFAAEWFCTKRVCFISEKRINGVQQVISEGPGQL